MYFNQSSIKKSFHNSVVFIKKNECLTKKKIEQIWGMTVNCISDVVKDGETISRSEVSVLLIKPLCIWRTTTIYKI